MNKKRIILSSFCVILLLALVGGTMAWFYVNEEVSVTYGNSIFCEAGDSLEIALVENGVANRWSSAIDYSAGEFTAVDISGNGEQLYRPSEIDENQQPVNLIPAVSSMEDSNHYDYIEMEVAFRSVSKMNVYLSSESFVAPVNPDDTTSNIYGSFSRDYIASAMRVAVIDDTGSLKMLWAPNSDYQLIQNGDGTYAFKTGSAATPESAYYFYGEDEDGNIVRKEISADTYASKKFVIDSTGAERGYTGNSPVLVSLNPEGSETHAQKTVKIRIWFEGTDREAHQALAGGNVNVKLKFVGISKLTDDNRQTAINAITFDQDSSTFTGLAEGMVFSTDGLQWTPYTSASPNLPVLDSGASIYIKYPETETNYETDYIKFTKD
ncbi:MAG: hypothetical protein E7434_02815 [Ruminococcaceae bacterium]|nr:hypothetical protein [Oscillospiraceae bacterium]